MTTAPVAALIWCPFPDRETAKALAKTLLDENRIACANIIPASTSLFIWQGKMDEAEETGALLKTTSAQLEGAVARLCELHPYDEPAIVGWLCDAAAEPTLAWLGDLNR